MEEQPERPAPVRRATPELIARADAIDALLERTFAAEPAARDFVNAFMSACAFLDDMIDGDAVIDDAIAWKMFDLLLYGFPANPFFLTYHALLLPVIRTIMSDYRTATRIERDARDARLAGEFRESDDCEAFRLLRSSFEQRNSFFDIVPHCVDILHGLDARTAFAEKWFPLTRDYEGFDDYVAKVTAGDRPRKPPYPE